MSSPVHSSLFAEKTLKSATSCSPVSLYLAPWVVPVSSPVIRDGAVAVSDGRILAVGSSSSLQAQFAGAGIETCQGVLLPGLVNAHIHLELSAFTELPRPTPDETFCDWIRSLIDVRQENRMAPEETARAARQMLQQQHAAGVLLLLDIGNIQSSPLSVTTHAAHVVNLLELLGPDAKAEERVLARIASLPDSVAATPHAPYSTTRGIMTALKQRADRLQHIFSLHVAESADEVELLRSGQGCFRAFLEERGAWENAFPGRGIDSRGTVGYLEQLGLLDSNLLCVHCVQVSEEEVRMLAERGCKVCLCPGSNRFLNVGIVPLELMLRHGLLPAIGTDSIASNEELDLWREMRILREDHPGVNPARIMTMATLGGALAMGREQDFGTLAPGRKAIFLNACSPALQGARNMEQLFDRLTGGGCPDKIRWIGEG
ncbi:MAG: amidohydrolase family protein [Desulfoarculaceae bacterium]|nr:amidohydrolase family protein [Desulfoarculaceae bacterium]